MLGTAVASDINNIQVVLGDGSFGLTADDHASTSTNLGSTIAVKGDGTNITTKVDGGALQIELHKDINLGTDGSVIAGNTTINSGGVTTNQVSVGGITLTENGIDGGQKQITHIASGGDMDTNAANIGDVKKLATTVTGGTNTTVTPSTNSNGGTTYQVDLKDTVTLGMDTTKQVVLDGTSGILKAGTNMPLDGVHSHAYIGGVNVGHTQAGALSYRDEAGKVATGKTVAMGNYVYSLSNTEWDGTHYVSGRAATEDQLHTVESNVNQKIDTINTAVENVDNHHTEVTVNGGTAPAADGSYTDGNLQIAQRTGADGQKIYDLKLSDNMSIGGAGKDGQSGKNGHMGINGADGKSGVGIDGQDGISIKGKDGKDGVTIKGIDGVDGVDGAEGHIGLNGKDGMTDIWTKPGEPGLNGKDGETMTRIVYKDPKGNTHEAATLDDGLKFGGDFGTASAVKLDKQINVKGNAKEEANLTDGNIGVVSSQDGDNGQLLIKLNKDLDLTEEGSVQMGNVLLNGSGLAIDAGSSIISLTSNGLNNGGKQLSNVASGTTGKTWDASVEGYDSSWNNGANLGDVQTAIRDIKGKDNGGFGLTADDGQSVKQDLGKTIAVTGDRNIETKVSDGKFQIALKKDVDLGPDGSIKTGDTTINQDGVETNQITIRDSSISISKDGIDAGNTVIKNVASGIVNNNDTDNSNAANIGDVKKIAGDAAAGAKAKSGKNITVKNDNTVNLNDKITLGDDTNKAQQVAIDGNGATVTAGDGDNQVKLNGSKGQITAGGATLGKQANTSGDKNPASGSYLNGLDNKAWDASHIQSGRAATEDQLKVVDDKIGGGRVFQGDDGKDNAVTVGLGDTMKLTGGADSANLINGNIGVVKNSDGDGLEIKLSKDIKGLDSVTTGNTTINDSGVTIKSSDATKGGDIRIATGDVSMGGSQIHDVAPGSNGTDAVNVNQLSSAMNNVERNFTKLDARVNRAGANAAALAALHPLDFDPDDKLDVAAGTGHYNGANAVAIGAFYRPNEDTMISLGGSLGGGENMINAGVTFKLGQHNHVSTTRVAMAKEIKALKALVNQQYGEMQQMKQMVNQLAGKTALSVDTSALFPDIPQNHWAYEYVTKLAHTGIVKGYPDGEFKGDRMMTRYEFATMLYRAIMGGAASNPDLNKDGTLDKLTKEFEPELKYIRIDVIQKDRDGVPTIERVRTTEAARYHRAGK